MHSQSTKKNMRCINMQCPTFRVRTLNKKILISDTGGLRSWMKKTCVVLRITREKARFFHWKAKGTKSQHCNAVDLLSWPSVSCNELRTALSGFPSSSLQQCQFTCVWCSSASSFYQRSETCAAAWHISVKTLVATDAGGITIPLSTHTAIPCQRWRNFRRSKGTEMKWAW